MGQTEGESSPAQESPPPAEATATSSTGALTASVALFICASLVMVLWHLQDASLTNANTGSRYATVESVVDRGTYIIDKSRYRNTVDKVKLDGHFYSSKPPVLPTYAAGVYWVYKQLTGHRIADYEGEVVWLCSLASGWLGHLVLLIYMCRLSKLLFKRQLAIIGTVAAAGFAYLGASYATTLNNHSVAAAFAIAGLYHTARARSAEGRGRDWVLAGVWLGFLPGLDLPSAAISAAFGLCLLSRDWRKLCSHFLPAALPGLALHLGLTYAVTGSIVPVYMRRELYDYPGSYWLNDAGIDALREPKLTYAFNLLLGHHGLFSMTPIFVFSVLGLVYALRGRRFDRAVNIAVAAVTFGTFCYYVVGSHNYGGWCVGARWLVPVMALLVVFFGAWLEQVQVTRYKLALLLLSFSIGAYNVQDGLSGPFQFSRWHNWLERAPNRNRTDDKINLGRAAEKPRKAKKPRSPPRHR